jgi:hypothetical protein
VDLQAKEVVAEVGGDRSLADARIAGVGRVVRAVQREARVAALRVAVGIGDRRGAGGALDLGQHLRAHAGVGAVQGRIAQVVVLQADHQALPHIGVEGHRRGQRGGRIGEVALVRVEKGRGRRPRRRDDLGGDAVDDQRPPAQLGGDGDAARRRADVAHRQGPAARRDAAADGRLQRRLLAALDDVDQLVPVGVCDHAPLLLIHAGVALLGAVAVSRELSFHLGAFIGGPSSGGFTPPGWVASRVGG